MPLSSPAEKILIRSVNWLGDAVMTLPAIVRLRQAKPAAHLTILTLDSIAELWNGFAPIDSVITFRKGESPRQVAGKLGREGFRSSLILPASIRSALESFLARIPTRIGYQRPFGSLLLTNSIARPATFVAMHKRGAKEIARLIDAPTRSQLPRPPSSAHHLHHYLHLAATLGAGTEPIAPTLDVTDDELNAFRSRFDVREGDEPIYGINPGAAYGSAKCWPAERFIDTALRLQREGPCRIWILGGGADINTALRIETAIRAADPAVQLLNLAGKTSLRELCAALRLCRVVISNDSGPMHLAAALGTRVVVPFGSTSLELTGPGLPGLSTGSGSAAPRHALLQGSAPCAPCFLRTCPIDHRCMTSIPVEAVVRACRQP